jgi:hypothetical protein
VTDDSGLLPMDAAHLWGWLWSALGCGMVVGFLLIWYRGVLHRR